MAQLAVQWLLSAQLVLDLAAVAGSLIASLEAIIGVVELVRSLGLPVIKTGLLFLLLLFGSHGGVCASGYSSSLVGAVWCHWSGEGAGGNVQVLGGSAVAVAEDGVAGRLAEGGDCTRGVCCGCKSLDGEAESTGSVGVLVTEGDSAKQDWSCPREGTEAGHIVRCGMCRNAAVTTSHAME
jgi:hypothetical protein